MYEALGGVGLKVSGGLRGEDHRNRGHWGFGSVERSRC
jgi:hypothetical protein